MEQPDSPFVAQPPVWSRPGEVTARDALRSFWSKAFSYRGRATRAEYNWALVAFLIYYAAVVAGVIGVGLQNTWAGVWIAFALLMLFVVPWIALIARRCHDMNRPGVFGLLLLATGIGFLIAEGFLMFSDSDPRGVRFDPPPSTTTSST